MSMDAASLHNSDERPKLPSTLHPQAAAFLEQGRRQGVSVSASDLESVRAKFDAESELLYGVCPTVGIVQHVFEGHYSSVNARVYRPLGFSEELPVILYFHGGGWVKGSLKSHEGVAKYLAYGTLCAVVAVEYRLAPEHPFPAAVNDGWLVVQALLARRAELRLNTDRLVLAGDSAGGNLAAATALRATQAGIPVHLQVLIYPAIDYNFATASYDEYAWGLNLTRSDMQSYWMQYLGSEANAMDPFACPGKAVSVGELPPAVIITAECDPLRDDGEAFALRLSSSGVPVRLIRYRGMIHGFLRMPALLDSACDARELINREIGHAVGSVRYPACSVFMVV